MFIASELLGVFAAVVSVPVGLRIGAFAGMAVGTVVTSDKSYGESMILPGVVTGGVLAASFSAMVGTADYREDFFSWPLIESNITQQQETTQRPSNEGAAIVPTTENYKLNNAALTDECGRSLGWSEEARRMMPCVHP